MEKEKRLVNRDQLIRLFLFLAFSHPSVVDEENGEDEKSRNGNVLIFKQKELIVKKAPSKVAIITKQLIEMP